MELDDFKNIFREKTRANSSKSKEEIESLLHKKTTSALEKIMRNMNDALGEDVINEVEVRG